jgi:hypothetical protein
MLCEPPFHRLCPTALLPLAQQSVGCLFFGLCTADHSSRPSLGALGILRCCWLVGSDVRARVNRSAKPRSTRTVFGWPIWCTILSLTPCSQGGITCVLLPLGPQQFHSEFCNITPFTLAPPIVHISCRPQRIGFWLQCIAAFWCGPPPRSPRGRGCRPLAGTANRDQPPLAGHRPTAGLTPRRTPLFGQLACLKRAQPSRSFGPRSSCQLHACLGTAGRAHSHQRNTRSNTPRQLGTHTNWSHACERTCGPVQLLLGVERLVAGC